MQRGATSTDVIDFFVLFLLIPFPVHYLHIASDAHLVVHHVLRRGRELLVSLDDLIDGIQEILF